MEKFEFNGPLSSWPDWFDDLVEKNKAWITTDTDPAYENDDDWQEYWIYIAYLWTPDGISIAYEGDTIINHGDYCTLDEEDL